MSKPNHTEGKRKFSRQAVVGAIVTTLLVTATIFGVSALSDPKVDSSEEIQLQQQAASQDLLSDALQAEESGDTTEAAELLERALALDANNADARDALTRIRSSQTDTPADNEPAVSDDPDNSSETVNDEEFLEPIDRVALLVPVEAPGWRMDPVFGDATAANATGEPTGETLDVASRVVFTVLDRETPEAAQSFIEDTSKRAYAVNSKNVSVDGANAYFGTDGSNFASVSYVRGRYVFEVIITSSTGYPNELEELAIVAATAFPDEMP